MNSASSELYRISTYSTWTSTAISPFLLARSGLLYSGKNDEVVCFACNAHLDGWRENDNPLERHRRAAPDCPLLNFIDTRNALLQNSLGNFGTSFANTNDITSNRAAPDVDGEQHCRPDAFIYLYHQPALLSKDSDLHVQLDRSLPDFNKLRQENGRLRTFHDWPSSAHADPEDLAHAGFFYTGVEDRVQCAFCRGFLRNWMPTDIPVAEHKRHFPCCSFVREMDVGSVPLATSRRIQINRQDQVMNGVLQRSRLQIPNEESKRPEYSNVESRIQSFRYGCVSPGQTAERLAEAGWFYIGPDDKVLCFQCGGNLKDWEPEDDPWEEHKKWYPQCAYIKIHRPGTQNQTNSENRQNLKNKKIRLSPFSDAVEAVSTESPGNELPNAESRRETPSRTRNAGTEGESSTVGETATSPPAAKSKKRRKKKRKKPSVGTDNLPTQIYEEDGNDQANIDRESNQTRAPNVPNTDVDIGAAAAAGPMLAENLASRNDHYTTNRALPSFDTKDEDWRSCKLCWENPSDVIFVPCGHASCQWCCAACRQKLLLIQGKLPCPFCKVLIDWVLSPTFTYISGEKENAELIKKSVEVEDNEV